MPLILIDLISLSRAYCNFIVMGNANLMLSTEELQIVTDCSFILTKNRIIGKVYAFFDDLSQMYVLNNQLPALFSTIPPKISKGEQYHGLPYLMLDFPRIFDKKDIFAVRTFFWWGNFFSITLHLKGSYQQQCLYSVLENFELLKEVGFLMATSTDEWEHHPIEGNYINLKDVDVSDFAALAGNHPFLKLSKTFPIQNMEQLAHELESTFMLLMKVSGN